LEPFVKPAMKTFSGQLVVVVEPTGEGKGRMEIVSPFGSPAIVTFDVARE
jgi:hypothetical protein